MPLQVRGSDLNCHCYHAIVHFNISHWYFPTVHSFTGCIEKMKTHYIGEFLYRYSTMEATRLELDKLYLQDFVAIVLKPASDKEAQVCRMCVHVVVSYSALFAICYFICHIPESGKDWAQNFAQSTE